MCLYIVNNFLSSVRPMEDYIVGYWQSYLFRFGQLMVERFGIVVLTKLTHTMQHVFDHIENLGCLRPGSNEENKHINKTYKTGYQCTNSNIECIAPQLLHTAISYTVSLTDTIFHDSSTDIFSSLSLSYPENIKGAWETSFKSAIDVIHTISGTATPATVMQSTLRSAPNGNMTSDLVKWVQLPRSTPNVSNLLYNSIFAGSHVYSHCHRQDALKFLLHGSSQLGFVEGFLSFSDALLSFPSTIVIVWLLVVADPDHDNGDVIETYGRLR